MKNNVTLNDVSDMLSSHVISSLGAVPRYYRTHACFFRPLKDLTKIFSAKDLVLSRGRRKACAKARVYVEQHLTTAFSLMPLRC